MVFGVKFAHLARPNLLKNFTHGYAQSLVAASQSSTQLGPFNNHPASRFGKPGNNRIQSAFQHTSNASSSGPSAKAGLTASGPNADSGLAAYYAAWQQHHNNDADNEWRQFQFTKRLEWKVSPRSQDLLGNDTAIPGLEDDSFVPRQAKAGRSYSASAVDDIRNAQDAAAAARNEVPVAERATEDTEAVPFEQTESGLASNVSAQASDTAAAPSQTPALTPESSELESPQSLGTSATTFSIARSISWTDQLSHLSDSRQYNEIPLIFQSMLAEGITPTASAYNSLLLAAINLAAGKHHVVPKALEVYSHMLAKGVSPNSTTYSIMLELLASRALEVREIQQTLGEKKLRYSDPREPGRFLFKSSEVEADLVKKDISLNIAMRIFEASTKDPKDITLSAETYRILIQACAAFGKIKEMNQFYTSVMKRQVTPNSSTFVHMMEAFASQGDLDNVIRCYNEFKTLAVADNNGQPALTDRLDNAVYAALIKAYTTVGQKSQAAQFLAQIVKSYPEREDRQAAIDALRDLVIPRSFMEERLDSGHFAEALELVNDAGLSTSARAEAMTVISVRAADADHVDVATAAYKQGVSSETTPAIALMASHVRSRDLDAARYYWDVLSSPNRFAHASLIEPTTLYAATLIEHGLVEEALHEARMMFARVRSATDSPPSVVLDHIHEGLESIGSALIESQIIPSVGAAVDYMWSMTENGGLFAPATRHALLGFGPEQMSQLNYKDLILVLQVQAGLINSSNSAPDLADISRFAALLETTLARSSSLDSRTEAIVQQSVIKVADPSLYHGRPDIGRLWQNYLNPITEPITPISPGGYQVEQVYSQVPTYEETFNPYAAATDRGTSQLIIDTLEKGRDRSGSGRLNTALTKLGHLRRAGRLPSFPAMSRLIGAAAREHQNPVVSQLLETAASDLPLLPQYPAVRQGWISIYDSMLGASLTSGDRQAAARYHQKILDLGGAPTANTYGLYITTMKESTKTFDEAAEALKIFLRAKSEGVELTPFLYNVLLGKLAKARRIDDCLLYYHEMRSLGLRLTSITYGSIINALCRVSNEHYAEEMFEEMESMPNYKPLAAPYNCMMQFYVKTKRDKKKVLEYYERMPAQNAERTPYTYQLLIQAHATLEPVDMNAAEAVFDTMRQDGLEPTGKHFSDIIHAKGCVLHDMAGARKAFDDVLASGLRPEACLYQALIEAMVANHCVADTEEVVSSMRSRGVGMTPYIANNLIRGWAHENNVGKAEAIYNALGTSKREPSTYEAMTKAFLSVNDKSGAARVIREMLSRGYPAAVAGKISELLGGATHTSS